MSDKKILIVDDLVDLRDTVASYLIRKGFKNLITAAKANEALSKIELEKPDFILLDIQLEDSIDGVEILRQTKSKLSPDSIVVMLTANKGSHELECKQLGALEVWEKPLRPNILLENIKRVLSN